MAHILVVDDEKNYGAVLAHLLEEEGYQVTAVTSPFAAFEVLAREPIALVLSDLKMPGMDGVELHARVREEIGEIPFIILTAFATVETAVQALKSGISDYLLKPFNNQEILMAVRRALEFARLETENIALRRELELASGREILGHSVAVQQLLHEIARLGPVRTSVLITGETGSGKELIARALHRAGPRSSGPLVSVNCAAFAANLLESELFGHEKGAFTGATERKRGLLEVARGGTLFLDEVGELPLSLQPKLLRVLEERRFRRVGGTTEIFADVRLLAATNRNLQEMIAAGTFREDLYYRLNVVTLCAPPLRERPEDIPLLALFFLRRFASELGSRIAALAPETISLLQRHSWPGNVRELQNVIERGLLFGTGEVLRPEALPLPLQQAPLPEPVPDLDRPLPEILDRMEKELIRRALMHAGGIQAKAADLLGVSRSNLQYKLRKYDLA